MEVCFCKRIQLELRSGKTLKLGMIVEENLKITTVVFNQKLNISKIPNDINANLIPNP